MAAPVWPLNLLGVLLFAWTVAMVWRLRMRVRVLYAYVTFFQGWSLVSSFVNDTGVYNPELGRHTEPTVATLLLAVLYSTFNLGVWLAGRTERRRPPPERRPDGMPWLHLAVWTGLFLYVLAAAEGFLRMGVPLLTGTGRAAFHAGANPLFRWFADYSFVLAFAAGLLAGRSARAAWSTLGVLVAVAVLTGHKFSGIVYHTVFVLAGSAAARPRLTLPRIPARYAVLGATGIAAAFVFSLFVYAESFGSLGTAWRQFQVRVLLHQGHLWWAVCQKFVLEGGPDPSHLAVELSALAGEPTGEVGMRYVMVQVLGAERAYAIFARGYLYTMAYPAILVTFLPYWVVVPVQLAVGGMFGGLNRLVGWALATGRPLFALVAVTILGPFISVLFGGTFATLVSRDLATKALLLAFLLAAGELRQPASGPATTAPAARPRREIYE